MPDKENSVRKLRNALNDFLASNSRANRHLRHQLGVLKDKQIETFIFGGAIREIDLYGSKARPKDLDLVFPGTHFDRFLGQISGCEHRVNRFGGVNVNWHGIDIDAWRLEDTWAFQSGYGSREPSFKELPKTTFLNIDAIAVELWPRFRSGRRVYENGYFDARERDLLEVNLEDNPFPELMTVRSLIMARKYHLVLGPKLIKVLNHWLASISLDLLVAIQESHYKRVWFDKSDLLMLKDRMRSQANVSASAFPLFKNPYQSSLPFLSEAERVLLTK